MKILKFLSAFLICVMVVCAMGVTAFAADTDSTPSGSNSYAYIKEVDGYVRVWGEGGGNASESFELKLYSDDTLIATTTLNNVGGIIDGDVYVTWNFYYPESTDEYWTTVWEEGHPNSAAQPTKVVLYIDGVAVNTTDAKMIGADNINPVKWRKLGGVAVADLEGEGTEASPYLITNLDELKWFRDDVNAGNTYEKKYINLTADIDLANEEWTPIGYNGEAFKGNFDGGSKTVKNLVITKSLTNSSENNGIGFFGKTLAPASITNLTIENVDITGSLYVGAVVGYGYTGNKIENCTVKGDIAIDAWWYAGVIGGSGYMNLVNNCHVIGNTGSYIKGNEGSYIGGIWGFRGEGSQKITNCTVENLSITGVDRVGGIAGIGHYGNTIAGCSASNVTVQATDEDATTVGLIVGACQGTATAPTTFEDNDVTDVTAKAGETEVTSIYGTNIYGTAAVTNYVADVNGEKYETLAEALEAAKDGDIITLISGDTTISAAGSVYGKTVTITGSAVFDWSKGNLFVGRGGEGNGTVIFDNANITSASNNSSTGIHVSGREKETTNKYDGTLIIKNSTIELDYLINRGTINVDNSIFTVKNGFGIAGRPAAETESGEAATATINITNGSYVKVLNHNGMGIGTASSVNEGYGVLNLTDSTFECASFNINGAKLNGVTYGDFNVYGASTLKIDALTDREIDLHHNAIIKDSTVGGEVMLYGKVTFSGDNTFGMLYDYGNAYSTDYAEWIVEKGASVTLTEKARYGLGYGDKVTIYGSLEDALTARETLTEDDISLFTHGLVAMSNWDVANSLTVKDAYVVIGSNNSFGNSASSSHTGTYDINFENAVLDASRITFYAANSKTDFSFVDSDVKVGTFMTRDADSVFTLTNTKLLSTTTTNGTDEGNYHAGTMTLTNSDLTYSAPLVMEDGTLTLDANSSLIAPVINGAGKISIDASEFNGTDVQVITADMSGYTGTVEVTGNENATYEITAAGVVLKAIPTEEEKYESLLLTVTYDDTYDDTNGNPGAYKLHLFAAIDSLEYSEVGFDIYYNGVLQKNCATKVVFKTVTTTLDGTPNTVVDPTRLYEKGNYIYGYTLYCPASYDNLDLHCVPYYVKKDGEKVPGYTFLIKDVYPSTAEGEEVQ